MQQKTIRKYRRGMGSRSARRVIDELTLYEMVDRSISVKKTEALSSRTINDYYSHFEYLKKYLGEVQSAEEVSLELFRGFVG
ncbi:hypothetical protein ACQCVH_06450 [Bacillus infantis]|uniref:hypothetical protein n=1 Tax=Bacillus infantis TaxID=324767 RepID=UPI003CF10DA7